MYWLCKTDSEEQTRSLAARLADLLPPGMVIAIDGELGAGKTVFAKGLAQGLGIEQEVTSPTFTLLQIYEEGRLPLYHVDAYRLESESAASDIGLEEFLDGDGICLVEWAENIAELFPADYLQIRMVKLGDRERQLEFVPYGPGASDIIRRLIPEICKNSIDPGFTRLDS